MTEEQRKQSTEERDCAEKLKIMEIAVLKAISALETNPVTGNISAHTVLKLALQEMWPMTPPASLRED